MTDNTKIVLIVLGLVILAGAGGEVVLSMTEKLIRKIAEAIAHAEGYYVQGSIPSRYNNPGDLTADITGKAVGQYGMYMVYGTPQDGWDALYKQVRLMFGGSRIYNPLMTIREVAQRYTATQQDAWAANVAAHLGVPVDTRLQDITV